MAKNHTSYQWATGMAVAQYPHDYTLTEVFLVLYMLSTDNAAEWLVHSTSITPQSLHNIPFGQMAKNHTDGQIAWLSRSNHMTIQLQRHS